MSHGLGAVYGLGDFDPSGGGFDWGGYFESISHQGLDILGATVTDTPYYAYNPNVATQTTSLPVYDPNARNARYGGAQPVIQPSSQIAAGVSSQGISGQIPFWAIVGGAALLGAFLFGRRR